MNYPEHPAEHIAHTVDKAVFLRQLSQFLKVENIVSAPEAIRPYDCDGMSAYQVLPWLVVLPETQDCFLGSGRSGCGYSSHRLGVGKAGQFYQW